MKYILLIYTDESKELHPGDDGWDALWQAYVELDTVAREQGVLIDSQPFTSSVAARTVSVVDDSPVVEPGPALPHDLQPAGYYLVECASENEAIQWAARIPAAATGKVEVRAIFEPGGPS